MIGISSNFQSDTQARFGTRFAYVADEFISIAGLEIPEDSYYEGYAQIENGIGMLRQFEDGMKAAFESAKGLEGEHADRKLSVILPCGTALFPYLSRWVDSYLPSWVDAQVVPITNDFFGDSVTVSGLLVGQDLAKQLKGRTADAILICETMLNSDGEFFLDDMTPGNLQSTLNIPVHVFPNDGEVFYHLITKELPECLGLQKENL